jgi:hypothetical protein
MTANCGVAALLRPGGPVRVPLRECCVAALVGADGVVMRCAAASTPAPVPHPDPALLSVLVPDPAPALGSSPPGSSSPWEPIEASR